MCVFYFAHTATRRGSALFGSGLLEPALQKRLRAASLDCAQSLILAMLQAVGQGGKGRNASAGMYEGRPVAEVVAAELVGIAGRVGGGADGVDGWVFLRDLEFRHSLAARLSGAGCSGKGAAGGGVIEEAAVALKDALAGKRKRVPPTRGTLGVSGAGTQGGAGQAEHAADMGKISQVRDILGDEFGEGFVAAMLKCMDNSVEGVIQALLEVRFRLRSIAQEKPDLVWVRSRCRPVSTQAMASACTYRLLEASRLRPGVSRGHRGGAASGRLPGLGLPVLPRDTRSPRPNFVPFPFDTFRRTFPPTWPAWIAALPSNHQRLPLGHPRTRCVARLRRMGAPGDRRLQRGLMYLTATNSTCFIRTLFVLRAYTSRAGSKGADSCRDWMATRRMRLE